MTGNNENKQYTSSHSVYIKLRYKSSDKMQLLAIRFENIHSPKLNIYYTHISIMRYTLHRLFQDGVCDNGYNKILPVDFINFSNKSLH